MPAAELTTRTVLTPKERPHVPLEAEVLSPDVVAGLSNSEIRGLSVYHGKRQLPLGEFFEGGAAPRFMDGEGLV